MYLIKIYYGNYAIVHANLKRKFDYRVIISIINCI